ncbi:hypothetical protein ACFXCU_30740 [Streptomyces virginiae]|uniref:hypothetical protein n=1 Tax=Streptomyces virginiae TaxID=1961 RepID=UPI00367B70C9
MWLIIGSPITAKFLSIKGLGKWASVAALLAIAMLFFQSALLRWKVLWRSASLPDRLVAPALLVYRRKIARQLDAEMKHRLAEWEIEKEEWKYEKTRELYDQIMSQGERGVLCKRCRNVSNDL